MAGDRGAAEERGRCTVCGGTLSASDRADGLIYHADYLGGPATCRPEARAVNFKPRTVTLGDDDVAFLLTLAPTLSAGVREAVRRLRATPGPGSAGTGPWLGCLR